MIIITNNDNNDDNNYNIDNIPSLTILSLGNILTIMLLALTKSLIVDTTVTPGKSDNFLAASGFLS